MSMTILISGSRDWKDKEKIKATLMQYPGAFVIVGDCRGVDLLTVEAIDELGGEYQSMVFYADWDKHGKAAGPIRNIQMLDYFQSQCSFPKMILIFHSDLRSSKGTKHLVNNAEKRGFNVKLIQ